MCECDNDSRMRTPKTTKEDASKASVHLGTGCVVFSYKKGYCEAVEAHTHTHTDPLQNASGTHARPPKSCKTIYFHLATPADVD